MTHHTIDYKNRENPVMDAMSDCIDYLGDDIYAKVSQNIYDLLHAQKTFGDLRRAYRGVRAQLSMAGINGYPLGVMIREIYKDVY